MNEHVDVLLPDHFRESDPIENNQQKFRTLYLLHGYYGNGTDWMRYSSIERYAMEHHIAVVMPSAYNSYYANAVHGLPYFDFIATEIPEYLQSMLPLAKDKKYNYVAGLSMGGYGALKIALTYPDRYSFAASLSGPLDFNFIYHRGITDPTRTKQFEAIFGNLQDSKNCEHNLCYLVNQIKGNMPKMYVICGKDDFLFDSNQIFINHIKNKNIDVKYDICLGNHTWDFWDEHIKDVLSEIDKLK